MMILGGIGGVIKVKVVHIGLWRVALRVLQVLVGVVREWGQLEIGI